MKSLITNYLNSRRSIRIDETILDEDKEESGTKATVDSVIKMSAHELEQQPHQEPILNLNLKFIDDNDSDSTSSHSSRSSAPNSPNKSIEHNNNNFSNQPKPDSNINLLNKLDRLKTNLESLCTKSGSISNQGKISCNGCYNNNNNNNNNSSSIAKSIHEDANLNRLKKFNIENNNNNNILLNLTTSSTNTTTNNNNNNNNNINDIISQIKICLNLINDNFLIDNLNVKNQLTNNLKMINDAKELTEFEQLLTENNRLKEKLNQVELARKTSDDELNQLKETFEMMRLDRKRLKCEKLELLNQTRDLYKLIESKENEIRDILKNYDYKTKETSAAVRKIIDSKLEIEREKTRLELQIMDLVDEKNQLNLLVESKNTVIAKLQKQLYELKSSSSSPRNSFGKESDCGYSSSSTKSRDTLSSSMIENATMVTASTSNSSCSETAASAAMSKSMLCANKCSTSSNGTRLFKSNHHATLNASKLKIKKDERNLKCKSNDSYMYVKNHHTTTTTNCETAPAAGKINATKLRNKFRFSSTSSNGSQSVKTMPTSATVSAALNTSCNLVNLVLNANESDSELNRVLDSDEFIDLDEPKQSSESNKITIANINHHLVDDECEQEDSDERLVDVDDDVDEDDVEIDNEYEEDDTNQTKPITHLGMKPTMKNSNSSSSSVELKDHLDGAHSTCSFSSKSCEKSSNLLNSLSPSVSLTSSSVSSYTKVDSSTATNQTCEKLKLISLNQTSPSCAECTVTMDDSGNTSSIIQLNSSQPHVKSRSSRILNTLIRMSTIGASSSSSSSSSSSNSSNPAINRSSVVIDTSGNLMMLNHPAYSTTLSSSKLLLNHQKSSNSTLSSKSSYFVNELNLNASEMNLTGAPHGQSTSTSKLNNKSYMLGGEFKSNNEIAAAASSSKNSNSCGAATASSCGTGFVKNVNCLKIDKEDIIREETKSTDEIDVCAPLVVVDSNVDKWSQNMVKNWLDSLGLLPFQVKNSLKFIKNGKSLLNVSESELEKTFMLNNPMHRRKLKLAIDELKYPEKIKYPKVSTMSNEWIVNEWLRDIGLVQYSNIFKLNLVDGRMLASLHRKDLDKHFGIQKRIHQTSLMTAIELLRRYDFDLNRLKVFRENSQKENRLCEISLWKNENFGEWLKMVNLQMFLPNLSQSGLHGALINDNSFNVDFLYSCLNVTDEPRYVNIKKILDDEIKLLKKSYNNPKNETVIMRPLTSFKNDKRIFTFRGSLGRALGKKIKRDISSPLIDDDTYKRIEFSHKIIDMKTVPTSSAV